MERQSIETAPSAEAAYVRATVLVLQICHRRCCGKRRASSATSDALRGHVICFGPALFTPAVREAWSPQAGRGARRQLRELAGRACFRMEACAGRGGARAAGPVRAAGPYSAADAAHCAGCARRLRASGGDPRDSHLAALRAALALAAPALLPQNIRVAARRIDCAAHDEEQVREPVEVVQQRRRQRLHMAQAHEAALRPPAYGAREMRQRRHESEGNMKSRAAACIINRSRSRRAVIVTLADEACSGCSTRPEVEKDRAGRGEGFRIAREAFSEHTR